MAYLDNRPKFEKEHFNAEFTKLVTFFKASMTADISEMYYERLKIYPLQAFQSAAEDHIRQHRPAPANFPTLQDLLNACSAWLSARPEIKHRHTIYNHPEDFEYPIGKLHEGFNVLEKKCTAGKTLKESHIQPFIEFADKERMPPSDRACVINKWRYIHNIDGFRGWVKNQKRIIKRRMANFGK